MERLCELVCSLGIHLFSLCYLNSLCLCLYLFHKCEPGLKATFLNLLQWRCCHWEGKCLLSIRLFCLIGSWAFRGGCPGSSWFGDVWLADISALRDRRWTSCCHTPRTYSQSLKAASLVSDDSWRSPQREEQQHTTGRSSLLLWIWYINNN